MSTDPAMPKAPILQPKQDFMRYFSRDCAGVKLFALLLIVLMEWGKTAMYVGVPSGVVWVIARHWA